MPLNKEMFDKVATLDIKLDSVQQKPKQKHLSLFISQERYFLHVFWKKNLEVNLCLYSVAIA